jgi:glycosyltransferase involved in cell wall biosynthesis
MATGIQAARGAVIVTMDGDGQNDPGDIPRLLLEMEASGADVVAGRRHDREEGLARRAVSASANGLGRWITGVRLHDSGCSLKAYRREVLQGPSLLRDDHRFLPALVAGRRAIVVELDVNDRARFAGSSHYGFDRIPRVAVDLIGLFVSSRFRGRPLRAAGWLAGVLAMVWALAVTGLVAVGAIAVAVLAAAIGVTAVSCILVAAAVVETLLRWPVRTSR